MITTRRGFFATMAAGTAGLIVPTALEVDVFAMPTIREIKAMTADTKTVNLAALAAHIAAGLSLAIDVRYPVDESFQFVGETPYRRAEAPWPAIGLTAENTRGTSRQLHCMFPVVPGLDYTTERHLDAAVAKLIAEIRDGGFRPAQFGVLKEPTGPALVSCVARDEGIAVRGVQIYDIETDGWMNRFDVLVHS